MNSTRDSRLELLRVIAAFLILCHHAIQHGGNTLNLFIETSFSINQLWSTVIGSWGQLGVTVFVIITCWFSTDKSRKNGGGTAKKILQASSVAWGYSLCICGLLLLFRFHLSVSIIAKTLLTPVYPLAYWYVTTYIIFVALLPILKIALFNISDKQLTYLCIVLVILSPVYNFYFENIGGYISYFITIYFCVAYLREHRDCFIVKHPKIVFAGLSLFIICGISVVSIFSYSMGHPGLVHILNKLHDCKNIITLIQGFALFFCFLGMRPFKSRIINELALTAYGTYIITENIALRGENGATSILWNGLFKMNAAYQGDNFIIYSIFVCLVTFVAAMIIDYIRILIKRALKINWDKTNKVDAYFDSIFDNLMEKE